VPDLGESFGSCVIRLDGAFNPAIVTPDWLLAKGLINESDHEYALELDEQRVLVTSMFSGGRYPWIIVEVARDTLNVSTTDETETPERVRDFLVGLLNALPETPVVQLVVTHFWHVATEPGSWSRLAEAFAPGQAWAPVAGETDLESLERRADLEDGARYFTLEESTREGYELFFRVDRYWPFSEQEGTGPKEARSQLDSQWDDTVRAAEELLKATLAVK
jgi:hypothetical protein